MRGLSNEEFKTIVDFVQEYHRFAHYVSVEEHEEILKTYPNMDRIRFNIKYIDSCYDTRDMSIWSISFRRGGVSTRFTTNMYNGLNPPPKDFQYHTLFDLIMNYLKGNFKPTEEYYIIL
jgi:hypothetical protein